MQLNKLKCILKFISLENLSDLPKRTIQNLLSRINLKKIIMLSAWKPHFHNQKILNQASLFQKRKYLSSIVHLLSEHLTWLEKSND